MDIASLAFTALFCALLLVGLLTRTVLGSRQIRHVVRHREAVPAAFAHTITPEAHRKAADYTVAKTRLALLNASFEAAVLIGWTLLGGLDWLNGVLLGFMGGGLLQQLALLGSFAVIGGLVGLPLSWYATFRVEERFGFNKTTPALWLADLVKGSVVGALVGLPIAALVLWLMGAAGPAWWIWAWGVWMGFNLLALVLYPTLIAPLFNKFEPLADETLKARVSQLMQRCGFAAKGLFVMDGSRRSAHANAYFTGFGAGKRVVFYDTLLKQLSVDEVEAVLAHELGHFKHKHITKRLISMGLMTLAGFYVLGYVMQQPWFYTGLGVMPVLDGSNNALALLLFMLVAPVFTFMFTPLMTMMSRKDEFQADAYAASQTQGQYLVSALLKLYEDNASTLTPDPLYASVYYSHPPASQRIPKILSQQSSSL